MKNVNLQKQSAKLWQDEQGHSVPFKYISPLDKQKEIGAGSIMKKAEKAHEMLVELKNHVKEVSDDIWRKSISEIINDDPTKLPKGNFTWYNFDRSVKIQIAIQDRIDFDDSGIAVCKAKLDEYLEANIESKEEFAKDLVMDAFETTNGGLDAKKVLSLLKWKSKIKNAKFQEAMEYLQNSIRRPDAAKYYRVWTRNEDGKYELINLNFSSL